MADEEPKKPTKTEQGRAKRAAEAAQRKQESAQRAQGRAEAQKRSEQRVGPGGEAKQNGGDRGTSERMSQREAAAGLNLAGNDPMSGRSDSFYVFEREIPSEETVDHGVHDDTSDALQSPVSSISVVICRDGIPFSASIQGIVGNEITD